MALFLIAFLVFISAAIQFGTTPNLSNPVGGPYRVIQNYSYLLANAGFYIGLSLSWLGLPLLLAAVGLDYLADVFIWLVLIAVLGGAIRISSSGLNILGRVDFVASLSLPVICFSGACFYRLGLDELWGDVLPSVHGTAMFAVLCFAVGAIGFSLQSALVGLLSRQSLSTATTTWGRLVLLPYTGAVFTSTSLLWLAVKAQP